jgi:hypothetical protein
LFEYLFFSGKCMFPAWVPLHNNGIGKVYGFETAFSRFRSPVNYLTRSNSVTKYRIPISNHWQQRTQWGKLSQILRREIPGIEPRWLGRVSPTKMLFLTCHTTCYQTKCLAVQRWPEGRNTNVPEKKKKKKKAPKTQTRQSPAGVRIFTLGPTTFSVQVRSSSFAWNTACPLARSRTRCYATSIPHTGT